mgnify:CR=1 FL=1
MAMKILAVLDYLPSTVGGAEVSAYLVLKGLVSKGHHVYILADKSSFSKSYCELLIRKDRFLNIFSCRVICPKIRPLGAISDILSLFLSFIATLRHAKIVRPNIIFTHKAAGLGASVAAKILGIPCVYVVRGYQHACFNYEKLRNRGNKIERCTLQECDFAHLVRCIKLDGGSNVILRILQVPYSFYAYFVLKLRRYAISKADDLVAISNIVKKSLEKIYPEKHIVKIYNPVDIIEAHTIKVDHNPFNKYFTYIGRLSRSKGVDILLKAFQYLLDAYPECKLAIIGSGPELNRLTFLARKLGIEKSTIFFGPMYFREVLKFLKERGFVTVVPSLWDEAFGRVVIESMAVGIPVIGSRVGGIPELISNEENGLLVNPGDERSLFNAMKTLIEDKALYERIAFNALHSAKEYSVQKIAAQYETLLDELIGRKMYERVEAKATYA